jgi:hypothetical protein
MTARKRRPQTAVNATRCHHCDQERAVARLGDWQLVNFAYPLPGLFSFYRELERRIGPDALLVVCLPCACFQEVGTLTPHDRGHLTPVS